MGRTIVIIVMFLLSTLLASCGPGSLDSKLFGSSLNVKVKKPTDKISPNGELEISGTTYSYGLQSLNTSVDKIFYVKNIGLGAVSEMMGSGLFAPFTFKGSLYPGTGGTCSSPTDKAARPGRTRRECTAARRRAWGRAARPAGAPRA